MLIVLFTASIQIVPNNGIKSHKHVQWVVVLHLYHLIPILAGKTSSWSCGIPPWSLQ